MPEQWRMAGFFQCTAEPVNIHTRKKILNTLKCAHLLSRVWLLVTPWTVAHQAPLSMEFSRQEHWRELPFPSPGDLPNPGIKPMSLKASCIGRWIFYHWYHLGSPKSEAESCSVVSDSATTWTCTPRLLCPWYSPGRNTGVGCHALLQGSFWPRDRTQSPALQADSLLSELQWAHCVCCRILIFDSNEYRCRI